MLDFFDSLLAPLRGVPAGKGPGSVLARGAGGSLAVKVAAAALALGLQILLTRLLGPDVYGDYILAITWVNLLGLIGGMGLNTASLRFLAAYQTEAAWGLMRGFLRRSHALALAASCAVALVLAAGVWLLRGRLRPELAAVFWAACLLIPVKVWLQLTGSGLQALKRVALAQAPLTVLRPLLLGGMVAVLVGLKQLKLSADATLWLNIFTTAVALLLSLALLRRCIPPAVRSAAPEFRTGEWTRVALPLLLMTAFQLVLVRTDVLMLGAIEGAAVAGVYAVAATVATLLFFGLFAIGDIAAPLFSELHTQGRRDQLQRVATLAARGSFLFALPVALGFVIGGKWFLGIFGEKFIQGHAALAILAAGQALSCYVGPVGILLTMTGRQREATTVIGVCALLNIALNAALIPHWGMPGAAAATVLSTLVRNLLLTRYAQKRLGLRARPF